MTAVNIEYNGGGMYGRGGRRDFFFAPGVLAFSQLPLLPFSRRAATYC